MKKLYTASLLLATWLYPVMVMAEYSDVDSVDPSMKFFTLLGVVFVITFYFLPTILAKRNGQCNNTTAVFLLNLFLGWSFIGWVIALIMATWKKDKSQESQ